MSEAFYSQQKKQLLCSMPTLAINTLKFTVYFLLYSLISTLTHEYAHFMTLKAIGGDGFIQFGIGLLVFPWDESHVIVRNMPTDGLSILLFTSSGSLFALGVLIMLYLSHNGRVIRAALELAIIPQITWTIVEPLARINRQAPGELSQIIGLMQPIYAYHLLLFASWLLGGIHLLGLHRRIRLASRN